MLTSDESVAQTCDIVEEGGRDTGGETITTDKVEKEEIPVPSFKIWEEDVGSGLRSKAQEVCKKKKKFRVVVN